MTKVTGKLTPSYDDAALRKLIHKLGLAIAVTLEGVEDHGDHCTFGSTNDVDKLREAHDAYWNFCVDNNDYGEKS